MKHLAIPSSITDHKQYYKAIVVSTLLWELLGRLTITTRGKPQFSIHVGCNTALIVGFCCEYSLIVFVMWHWWL